MKLYLVLCALASVAFGGTALEERDLWQLPDGCTNIEALDVITGEDADCPFDGRADKVKSALECRCGLLDPAGTGDCSPNRIAEKKKCLCSNRRLTASGVAIAEDARVGKTCPARPRDCPTTECLATDFFTINIGAETPFALTEDFAANLDRLPDALKQRLEDEVMKLEFLQQFLSAEPTTADYVKAMKIIQKLSGYIDRVAQFFKDENGCLPCRIPKCFYKLHMLPKCRNADDEKPFIGGKQGIFSAAMGLRSLCPDCRPTPPNKVCPQRSTECAPGQDADINLETGCPECHPTPKPKCPRETRKNLEDCAAGVKPERNPNTGCLSCKRQPNCPDDERPLDADIRVCRFGEQPLVDGCFRSCRKPTREEKKALCTQEAKAECKANFDNLRVCDEDEAPQKDWGRCCPTCRRPEVDVCTNKDFQDCRDATEACPPNQPQVRCDTDDQKATAACREHPIGGKHCCLPCFDPIVDIDPIDVAECEKELPYCREGESDQGVDVGNCGTCKENPCNLLSEDDDCDGCTVDDDGFPVCAVKEVVTIGLDLAALPDLLMKLIQLDKREIGTLIKTIVKRFCATDDMARLEKCMHEGYQLINSIKPLVIRLVIAGVETILNDPATKEQAVQLFAGLTAGTVNVEDILCRLTLGFSIDPSQLSGGRRLLGEETKEGQLLQDALADADAGGGVTGTAADPDDVIDDGNNNNNNNNNIDEEEDSAGVALTPSLALMMALVLMLWK